MKIEEIKKYKYVSFDIFDTLIVRNVSKPIDIFKVVENEYNKNHENKLVNFQSLRIAAEIKARKNSNKEEITLEEIYENLKVENKEEIKTSEIEIEKAFMVKNLEMFDIYNKCLENNIKVVITSDMYLSKEIIEEILKLNGYDKYEKLYLSSELKLTKSKGTIFEFLLKDLNISKEDIVHIGDNKKSDYLKPQSLGIPAIWYNRNFYKIHKIEEIEEENKLHYNSLNSFIENHIDINEDYFWKFGYETLGPLLYSYTKWLKESFTKENYKKVFFLARDGYIMQKAFELINDTSISHEYMYASRRALIVPTLWMYDSLEDMLSSMFLGSRISVNALVKRLGLNPKEKEELLKQNNLELDMKLEVLEISKNQDFIKFYETVKEEIKENSQKEYNNLLKYYNEIDFSGKVAIVDIGWFGNMQNALNNIIQKANMKVDLTGYYVGIVPESKNQEKNKMHGFLFEKNKNEDLFLKKKYFNSIFEMIFLSTHGSVKNYNGQDTKVDFYEFEYENSETEKNIRKIQDGALQFIKDFCASKTQKYIEINERISLYNMMKFGNYPSLEDTEKFGDIIFYDDDNFYLAKPRELNYYIIRPKEFYNELMNSVWMPGFLKRLFKVELPYFKFILFLRKLKKN